MPDDLMALRNALDANTDILLQEFRRAAITVAAAVLQAGGVADPVEVATELMRQAIVVTTPPLRQ
jgi:hypothetical protein